MKSPSPPNKPLPSKGRARLRKTWPCMDGGKCILIILHPTSYIHHPSFFFFSFLFFLSLHSFYPLHPVCFAIIDSEVVSPGDSPVDDTLHYTLLGS